jgi:hypothetical protein
MDGGLSKLPPHATKILEAPIPLQELRTGVRAGKARKAPGCDGLSHEFFKSTWEVKSADLLQIMNTMYLEETITETQKRGVILCIPKTPTPTTPNEYRHLTLLNTDYKILARLISNRL